MNFFDYAFHHVGCIVRLLRGDVSALEDMDISADGFWRSFEALPAALPALFFSWVVEARSLQAAGNLGSTGSIIARMAMLEIVFWVVPIIAFIFVLKALGLSARYTYLIVSRNWLSALAAYFFVAIPLTDMATGEPGSSLSAWLTLAAIGLMLWFSVRVTRVALNVSPMTAVAFVGIETVITYPLAVSAYVAAGLYPAS